VADFQRSQPLGAGFRQLSEGIRISFTNLYDLQARIVLRYEAAEQTTVRWAINKRVF